MNCNCSNIWTFCHASVWVNNFGTYNKTIYTGKGLVVWHVSKGVIVEASCIAWFNKPPHHNPLYLSGCCIRCRYRNGNFVPTRNMYRWKWERVLYLLFTKIPFSSGCSTYSFIFVRLKESRNWVHWARLLSCNWTLTSLCILTSAFCCEGIIAWRIFHKRVEQQDRGLVICVEEVIAVLVDKDKPDQPGKANENP